MHIIDEDDEIIDIYKRAYWHICVFIVYYGTLVLKHERLLILTLRF